MSVFRFIPVHFGGFRTTANSYLQYRFKTTARLKHIRTPIPFIDQLKQCRYPDEYLTLFQDFTAMGYNHEYPCFASLIYKLARARKFDQVEAVLGFLRTHDIRCKEAPFIGLIRQYGKANMIDKAMEVFLDMGRSLNCVRTRQSFNTILNVLVDGGRVREAAELFQNAPKMGFRLNSVSYNIMMKMWMEKDELENAMKMFDEMLQRNIEPTVVTYNCRIGFLCRRGEVEEAKRVLDELRKNGKRGNAVSYALLMEGLCASGKFNEARKLMFDMEYHGCKVELVNYGVLITDLTKRGSINEAKKFLIEMKKRNIKPDVVIYNILISYFCRTDGKASDGYKMLVDMQVKGCEPNATTYRTVVDGLCNEEDYMGALKVVNAMLVSKACPRVETFRHLVVGLLRDGKLEEVGFLLKEMNRREMSLGWSCWEILVKMACKDADDDGNLQHQGRVDQLGTLTRLDTARSDT